MLCISNFHGVPGAFSLDSYMFWVNFISTMISDSQLSYGIHFIFLHHLLISYQQLFFSIILKPMLLGQQEETSMCNVG